MKRGVWVLVLATVVGMGSVARGTIVLGDFSMDQDGWSLAGDANYPQDRSSERVQRGDGTWALRANYFPYSLDPYALRGWSGLEKYWDPTGQTGVTELSIPIDSYAPWEIIVCASFSGIGEIALPWTFWPQGTLVFNKDNFGVTAEQFNLIYGARIYMDDWSGGKVAGGGDPMYLQIYNVTLNGVPEPATMGLFALAGLLLRRRYFRF